MFLAHYALTCSPRAAKLAHLDILAVVAQLRALDQKTARRVAATIIAVRARAIAAR